RQSPAKAESIEPRSETRSPASGTPPERRSVEVTGRRTSGTNASPGDNVVPPCRVLVGVLEGMEMGRQGRVRCPVCGKQFIAGRGTYYSDECRKPAQMRRYRTLQDGRLPLPSP